MSKLNLGVLIYTYDRTDDAKINMEIIRRSWQKNNFFSDIKIVHCFNGQSDWYPKKYLENDLIRIKNTGHFQGAAELIDAGVKLFNNKYRNINYLVFLAADTWLIKPSYLNVLIKKMVDHDYYWSTCAWGLPKRNKMREVGSAIDFFIINYKWAKKYKFFPIKYKLFYDKYHDLLLYKSGSFVSLEKLVYARFLEAIFRQNKINVGLRQLGQSKILTMKDRQPVHTQVDKQGFWIRKMFWPKIGLLSHHDPNEKQKILKNLKIGKGKSVLKLINSTKFDYYNSH